MKPFDLTRLAGGFDVFSLFSRAFVVGRRFRGALDALRVSETMVGGPGR